MTSMGTQAQKRRRKAVPPAEDPPVLAGCLVWLAMHLFLCASLFAFTQSLVIAAFALPALIVMGGIGARFAYGLVLLAVVRRTWSKRGVRCLMVYSHSPTWETHIRTTWVPRLGAMAVALNWSERSSWRSTLEVRLFRRFCGQQHNFNPAVVVFRGLDEPQVFRFFHAFQELKAGRPEYVQHLESELWKALELD